MKRLIRRRWFQVIAVAVLVLGSASWLVARDAKGGDEALVAKVKKGDFKVVVTSSGELRAPKFVQVTVPANANQAEQYQMKIASLIPEGAVVKEGDVVAVFDQAMLDSTLNLSKAREDIHTGELGMEEKKLAKEQAVYEAPSVRRQADIDYEKAERALAQSKLDYKTKTDQAKAKMREVGADFDRQKSKVKVVQDVMGQFTIKAPAPGMVIYVKEWNGKKRVAGSQVSSWDPAVATLPDLTQMESITYVNEIDIRKLSVGQPVTVTLDADATKKLTGKIVQVANVGEQRPNADAKVFEVKVSIEQADTTLRPGMTTGNLIQTYAIKDVLSVPLEAVVTDAGIPYVFLKSGASVTKQEVELGAMNHNEVVVTRGVTANDRVLLLPPANKDKLTPVRLPGSKNVPKAKPGDDAAPPAQTVPVKPTPAPPKTAAPTPKKG